MMDINNKNEMLDDEIDLKDLFRKLWSFRGFILRVTLLIAILTTAYGLYRKATTPAIYEYEAETLITVVTSEEYPTQKTVFLNLLNSRTIADEVTKNLELSDPIVSKMISITPLNDTNVVRLTTKYKDSEKSITIANELATRASDLAISSLPGIEITAQDAILTGSSTQIKGETNVTLYAMIGLILGAMLSVFIGFFMEYTFGKVSTKNDLQQSLGLEVFGDITSTVNLKRNGWWPWKRN